MGQVAGYLGGQGCWDNYRSQADLWDLTAEQATNDEGVSLQGQASVPGALGAGSQARN